LTNEMLYGTQGLGSPFGKLVAGSKTATALTTTQISTESIPIGGVWVGADTLNSDVILVGNSSVLATQTNQAGIVLFAGNPSIFIPINNLDLLYMQTIITGDRLCYAYLQPFV